MPYGIFDNYRGTVFSVISGVRYFRLLVGYGIFGNNGNYLITVYWYSEIPEIPDTYIFKYR